MATSNSTYVYSKAMRDGDIRANDAEVVDGMLLGPGIPASRVHSRKQMQLRPDDVFIVSFPKSGTSWMQHIVKLIVNNGEDNGVDNDACIPWIDVMTNEEVDALPSPRFMKTHMWSNLMLGGNPEKAQVRAKYIYVMRNPKDSCVSYFHFLHKVIPAPYHEPWDKFFDRFHNGKEFFYGPFQSHIASWWALRNAPNVLITTFESLARDLSTEVARIAKFLDRELSTETLRKIVAQTTFDAMKDNVTANKEAWCCVREDLKFMRKGVVGDWRNQFTPEQSAAIDQLVATELETIGVSFDYGD